MTTLIYWLHGIFVLLKTDLSSPFSSQGVIYWCFWHFVYIQRAWHPRNL